MWGAEAALKGTAAFSIRKAAAGDAEGILRAMRFYERNGFRPSGVVRDFFGMPLFEYVKLLEAGR